MPDPAWRALAIASSVIAHARLNVEVHDKEQVPASGPVIVAARHFHHLYDGCVLLSTIKRPAHILVGLDWVRHPAGQVIMQAACRAARWPVIYRSDSPYGPVPGARARLQRATRESLALLKAGRVVIIFPEGYPNIDPGLTPKTTETAFLPFRAGAVRLAVLAARQGLVVPIVPAGLCYTRGDKWAVRLRFGEAVVVPPGINKSEIADAVTAIEQRVRDLSAMHSA